jgi:hypothetical protein
VTKERLRSAKLVFFDGALSYGNAGFAYIAQALRSKSVTTTETTIDPTIPSQFEKKRNM